MGPRQLMLGALRSRRFDVLVIGGGIVGAGIARDAALRGLSVALIEQGDFAGGASSKTSKLIHGGLRYLEQRHITLVRESLRERRILRSIAPGYVRPLSLLLPVYAGDRRPAWQIHLGLLLYDLLAGPRNGAGHQMLSRHRLAGFEPHLRMDGLRAAGLYRDCQMDDARLCLLNVLQAIEFGGVCVNYVRLTSLLRNAQGQACGGALEDVLTGRALEVQAAVVVNATGPWADGVRRLSRPGASARLAPTKGIHLVTPKLANEGIFARARDARMLFLLPWGEQTLIGTTESKVEGPLDELSASADEVGYLLDETNRLLPGAHLGEADILMTFAGARPLLAFAGPAHEASREHQIEVDAHGLISVLGGKYTTYRRMAQQAVDLIVRRQRWQVDRCLSDQVSLLETVHPVAMRHWHDLTQRMDPESIGRLLLRYGTGTFSILRLMARDPLLRQPFCPHHDLLAAEVAHAFQEELACTITDALARRTRVAFSPCQGLDALSLVSQIAQRYGGMSEGATDSQAEAYHRFLQRGLAFRSSQPAATLIEHDD